MMRSPVFLLLALALFLPASTTGASGLHPAIPSTGAPPLMLAERLTVPDMASIDPADWWVSEKLDGVRAIWDGERLRLRSGAVVAAPAWFLAGLPAVALDGELWIGRRSFDRLAALVRRAAPEDDAWRAVRYMIFDLPGATEDFSGRVARMRALTKAAALPWLQPVAQLRLSDAAALRRHFDEVLRGGGEGLMLHRADARWMPGRSAALLKLVPWHDDEARVVAHLPGKGRLHGLTGSLLVETADGRRFRLGSGLTDAQRRAPPAVGSLVTYRYRELTPHGQPRFPRFLRVRELP
ncbi:MAG: DNA ligase [Azospira sp.]|jgi:DNA ligase-1|nr:DNA ligase [Azospira sp.]